MGLQHGLGEHNARFPQLVAGFLELLIPHQIHRQEREARHILRAAVRDALRPPLKRRLILSTDSQKSGQITGVGDRLIVVGRGGTVFILCTHRDLCRFTLRKLVPWLSRASLSAEPAHLIIPLLRIYIDVYGNWQRRQEFFHHRFHILPDKASVTTAQHRKGNSGDLLLSVDLNKLLQTCLQILHSGWFSPMRFCGEQQNRMVFGTM